MKPGGIAAAAICLCLHGLGAQQRSIFRAETDLVHFAVTVTDRRGAAVTDLTADDFEILENGASQTIAHFARSDDANAPELHLGLMLDTSESMLADLAVSQTAAIKFLNRVPEAADLTLVGVDSTVRTSRFSQDDFPRLVERIRSSTSDGYTALYDGFAVYLDGAADDEGRSVLVAFTDGGDSRSSLSFGDLVDVVRASRATIYVVGLLDHAPSDVRNVQRIRLMRIADESGGQAIFPSSMRQIEEAYDRIVAELRAQYSLGYVSTDPRRDGRWQDVEIRIRHPDRNDLRVRARSGYFAWRDAEP
jgi:VWFA-related protein